MCDEFTDGAQAFLLKTDVSDAEGLVYDEDVGVHVNGHGKSQPDVHAAGVMFDGLVDKCPDISEGDDGIDPGRDLLPRQALD